MSRRDSQVEICSCGKFRFTENAGPAIVEQPSPTRTPPMAADNFHDRLCGRIPANPVTVGELEERLAQFRKDAKVEMGRSMLTVSGPQQGMGVGFLDEPAPVTLKRD